ncbi:unnamed protein product [Protopolystoma xenopodis]|uniref:Uncharacterized protein n=1 Tax=Protopolystoma xenopodis TaxID=117903 RepID=A0A3S5C1S0_9PLAT|nr:unnamed protein product [Protopolystoma xenopodis]
MFDIFQVVSAFNVLLSQARGPRVLAAMSQLSRRLARLYLAGRLTCPAISVTGHPCREELHRVAIIVSHPSAPPDAAATDAGDGYLTGGEFMPFSANTSALIGHMVPPG